MHIYIYTYIHVYMYTYIHIRDNVVGLSKSLKELLLCSPYEYNPKHIRIYTYTHVYIHAKTTQYICTYIHTHIPTHQGQRAYIHIYIYTCIHVYIYPHIRDNVVGLSKSLKELLVCSPYESDIIIPRIKKLYQVLCTHINMHTYMHLCIHEE